MSASVDRVLVLGLDGGTMAAFGPLFDRGLMPHLASLWRRSATGTLRSSDPMVTPVAWTSFSTGCLPATHGIHEFNYIEPSDRTVRPNHAGRVKVPTLWHALDAAGRDIVSMNLPMTYPPPGVRGIVVAGSDAPSLDWAFAGCPDFRADLAEHVPDYTNKIVWKTRPRTLEELRPLAARNRTIFEAQAAAAERADARVDWSAMMVHFHNLDSLQHRLWPELDVDDTGLRRTGWNAEVEGCLMALDAAVGRLLDLAARRDAAVVAVSDHGFGPCRSLVNVNGLLRKAGLQKGLLYGTRFRYRASRIADRLRRWVAKHTGSGEGMRTPRSVEGQVGCDWSKSAAFSPFGQLAGSIYLNTPALPGSSAAGRVTDEVIGAFLEARDPKTNDPLFRDVFSLAERYGIDPAADGLPDVLALSADGYQAQAKWSVRGDLMRPDPRLPATHYREGVIAIDAPGVRKGTQLSADLHDVAPTLLSMLGERVPTVMEGRVLHEAFDRPLDVRRGSAAIIRRDPARDALLMAAGLGAECA
ncbi:alkaline phosphatase family protein [Isosphaeraceae bacterium EP7]